MNPINPDGKNTVLPGIIKAVSGTAGERIEKGIMPFTMPKKDRI